MEDPEISTERNATSEPATSSSYGVLRNRDLLLYLISRLFATFGQQMVAMAVGWEVYERTHQSKHGGWALMFVGLTQVFPMILFTLPAGHVADNYNRKKIIVLTTLIVFTSSLGLTAVSAWHAPLFWLYVSLFVSSSARTFLWAASASFLPLLVERRDFARAVNWNATGFNLSAIFGPPVAGFLIDLTQKNTAALVYAFNAVATLICCVLVVMVRRHHTVAVKEPMTLRGLLTGFKFVFANRIVLGVITLDLFAVLFGAATALLPIYAKEILDIGPNLLGLLTAALPMGAVLCTFILAHGPPLQKAGRALMWSVAAFGVATILFGYAQWFWLSFLLLFVSGAVDNISVVVRHTLVQMLTPDEKRGRVSAVNNLFIGTSNELGGARSSLVAQVWGPTLGYTMAHGAIVSAVSGGVGTILVVILVAWMWPEIRKYGRLDTA
jgi:MFS family permease